MNGTDCARSPTGTDRGTRKVCLTCSTNGVLRGPTRQRNHSPCSQARAYACVDLAGEGKYEHVLLAERRHGGEITDEEHVAAPRANQKNLKSGAPHREVAGAPPQEGFKLVFP